jgi:cobalt-zinc-cadmium resistance protein CzcA
VPATFVAVSQPIEERVNQLLAGSRSDVVINVFGSNLTRLKTVADPIADAIRDIPGRGDPRVQRDLGLRLLEVKPDRLRRARYGIAAEDAFVGHNAGRIFEGARRSVKRRSERARVWSNAFARLRLRVPSGGSRTSDPTF